MKMTEEIREFLSYCWEWYGKGGIYDHGATPLQVANCVMKHLENPDREAEFKGDSFDREQVREWLERTYNLSEIAHRA